MTRPDLKPCYKATVIKMVWCWHRNKDQWNRIESLEVSPNLHSQFIFDEGTEDTVRKRDALINDGEKNAHAIK